MHEPEVCDRCGERPIAPAGSEAWSYDWCEICHQNAAEAAYEDSLGECFRGGEAEAFHHEQQARVKREAKG